MSELDNLEVKAIVDANNELRLGFSGISREEMEELRTLASSPFWRTYRKILIRAQAEFSRAALRGTGFDGMIDSWKNQGISAGINFSVNQVQVLLDSLDSKEKKILEKDSKPKQPFRRG